MCDTIESRKAKSACIIGGGVSGLCALKHCLQKGIETVCYEKSKQIGGTWVFDDNVEYVQHKEDVQSSMYEGLRTNLPKEVMGYPDFDYSKNDEDVSFITADKVVDFLESYAKHFDLNKFIKLETEVIRVRPKKCGNGMLENSSFWEVYVKDLKTGDFTVQYFDFIFICNGHYTVPAYPEIEDIDLYEGRKLHSHLYRKASNYKDETILIIGCGSSGVDMASQLNEHAKHVFLSHHLNPASRNDCLKNVTHKPDVSKFTKNGAIFKDNTSETFSMILFCTGYQYSFPFLSIDCELSATEQFVQPLYKHIINIHYPTMAMIGLPFKVCPNQLFDLQTRFALKYFLNEKQLPSTEEMLDELKQEIEERKERGLPPRRFHEMGEGQFQYYQDLADTAEIEPIKPVICNIMKECRSRNISELETYRNNYYKILDNENFSKQKVTT